MILSDDVERQNDTRHGPSRDSQLTLDQRGLLAAAAVAFLGIAYFGPALTRFRRRPSLSDRMADRLRVARRDAQKAGVRARKQARRVGRRFRHRLGDGPVWR